MDLFNTLFPQSVDEKKTVEKKEKEGSAPLEPIVDEQVSILPESLVEDTFAERLREKNEAFERPEAVKKSGAYRTISEAAKEIGVATHVLRFWETKFPHVQPMKRSNGRRYYKEDDVQLLKGIRFLLHERGFTIKGVQQALGDNTFQTELKAAEAPVSAPAPRKRKTEVVLKTIDEKDAVLAELRRLKRILSGEESL